MAGIVTGGLVLAVVTSLPNAVAAIYLALRGRGAAALRARDEITSSRYGVSDGRIVKFQAPWKS